MKKNRVWGMLAGLTLAGLIGVGFHPRTIPAQAAAASTAAPARTASGPRAHPTTERQMIHNEEDAYRMSPSVVALGRMLGLSPEQSFTVFDVTNFLLLVAAAGWVLMRIGLPFLQIDPVPKMLRDRGSAIQKQLVDARTATEEASARLSGVEERLGRLDGEIAAMRSHAEQDWLLAEQHIKATLEDEKKRILSAAEQEIAAATGHAQKQLQQYAAGLAIEQAAHRLVVTAETDRLLVQGFAEQLTGGEPKKGQN